MERTTNNVLVTGGAGFIGSNLVGALLDSKGVGKVRVLDNLSTGHWHNIEEWKDNSNFEFLEGDIRDYETCLKACQDIDVVSHQAALGSVPRSINDPLTTNEVNILGTLNVFTAAKESGVDRVVYAASSSTYGDHPGLPKVEDQIGNPLSPYAVTKLVNEQYASVFQRVYGFDTIGLRYFNIFGPKQDPNGAYAAVIPLFVKAALSNEAPFINGDGLTSRDFTFVDNAVQANIKALFTTERQALNQVYNVACNQRTTLLDLWNALKNVSGIDIEPIHKEERKGDVKHSLADISKIRTLLGYEPTVLVEEGIVKVYEWYKEQSERVTTE